MSTLIITPDRNTGGKKDYTGAFQPMAESYKKWLGKGADVDIVKIDVSKPMDIRFAQLVTAVKDHGTKYRDSLSKIVIFSHGWSTGIQVGLSDKTKADVKKLKEFVAAVSVANTNGYGGSFDMQVALFCCSTGADDGVDSHLAAPGTTADKGSSVVGETSFADTLRDELCLAGMSDCRVFAHTTAGHTTRNPDVLFFDGMGSATGGIGGVSVAPRGSKAYKALTKKLKDDAVFPFVLAGTPLGDIPALLV